MVCVTITTYKKMLHFCKTVASATYLCKKRFLNYHCFDPTSILANTWHSKLLEEQTV
jgi:hypothetical protein